jgi:NAD(P)-dependent dehydrogenase (short-subunit alcohol dehydrogenase family)
VSVWFITGVHVTIIEPGFFRTDFLDSSSLHTADQDIADYAENVGAVRQLMAERNQLGTDTLTRVGAKLDFMHAELARWREISASTDLDA